MNSPADSPETIGCVYHFVMKLSRPALAAVLSASLVLAACSGDEGDPQNEPTTPESTSGTAPGSPTSDVGTATETSSPTQSPSGEATESPTSEPTDEPTTEAAGSVSIEDADRITQEVLDTAAAIPFAPPGDERSGLLRDSYAGPARDAMRGQIHLMRVTGGPEGDEPEPVEPTVLAISQPTESEAKYILAQTVPDNEIPRLHLLATDGDLEDFRIVWEGDMLPGARIGQFERRSEGSPVVDPDSDLGATVLEAHVHLAELLDYPHPEAEAAIISNGYSKEVRDQARSQANAVSAQAEFEQTHSVLEQEIHTLELGDGSVLSFAVTERASAFDLRDGMQLTPPDTFRAFVDDATLTDSAQLDWLVFTALQVPQGSGNPSLIAVTEQIVGASGT